MTRPRIGIDLGGSKIESIVMDRAGTVVARRRDATPRDDYDATVAALVAIVAHWDAFAGGRLRVGVGTPGVWDEAAGAMKNCNSTWLNGRALRDDLVARLGDRVRLANDANCFALSEAVDGAAAGHATVFGVILGTGVGGGIVVDGRALAGANGVAGEWGHTPLPYFRVDTRADDRERTLESALGDRPCFCGRANCVETFLSGPGLVRLHHELWAEDLAAPQIAAAPTGSAALTMALYARFLARALAQVVNVLDPHAIVLGGGLSNVPVLYERVPALWSSYVFSATVNTVMLPPQHGDASGVRGAARLWPD